MCGVEGLGRLAVCRTAVLREGITSLLGIRRKILHKLKGSPHEWLESSSSPAGDP